MIVVRQISTNRLVYREYPDFKPGMGTANALASADINIPKEDLEEIEVTEAEWQAELDQRQAEMPLPLAKRVEDLEGRVNKLEGVKSVEGGSTLIAKATGGLRSLASRLLGR